MNQDFIEDFLEFVRTNNIKFKSDYASIVLVDANENDIVALTKSNNVVINSETATEATDKFVSMLFEHGVKIAAIIEPKYELFKGIEFKSDDKPFMSIDGDGKITLIF